MTFWTKRRQRKIEALGDRMLALLTRGQRGYKNRSEWSYFALRLCSDKNDKNWLSNAREPLFSAISNLWARGFPVCVYDTKFWYPNSLEDAMPCLEWFEFRLEMAERYLGLIMLRKHLKTLSHLPENERIQAILALLEETKGQQTSHEISAIGQEFIDFLAALKKEFGEESPH